MRGSALNVGESKVSKLKSLGKLFVAALRYPTLQPLLGERLRWGVSTRLELGFGV